LVLLLLLFAIIWRGELDRQDTAQRVLDLETARSRLRSFKTFIAQCNTQTKAVADDTMERAGRMGDMKELEIEIIDNITRCEEKTKDYYIYGPKMK